MQTYCRHDAAAILEEIGRIGLDKCIDQIANEYKLSDKFLMEMGHLIDIFELSSKIPMDVSVYKKYANRLDWNGVTSNIELDIKGIDFLLKNIDKVTPAIFDRMSSTEFIDCNTLTFIINHFLGHNKMEKEYWEKVSKYEYIDSVFMRKYDQYLDWYVLSCKNKNIPIDLIILHATELNWRTMWFNYKFSEEDLNTIIKTLTDKVFHVDWCAISSNQTLTEKFMDVHEHELNWNMISEYQNMSYEFMYDHAHVINLLHLDRNIITDRTTIDRFLNEFGSLSTKARTWREF